MKQYWREIVIGALVLFYAFGFVKDWYEVRIAETVSKAEQRIRDEAAKKYEAEIKRLEDEKAAIKTLPQAVKVIERYIPQAVPAATVQKQDIAPAVAEKLPESPGYTVRTQQQETALANEAIDFQKCKADLGKCGTDRDSYQRDAEQWKKTANGGSKFRRVVKVGTCVGLAVGGAKAGEALGGGKGAAIGAGAGVLGCQFVF